MTQQPDSSKAPLQIKTPCPKTWDQLSGDNAKRFCSECSLHVHNATALTRREALELVSNANERVCMRMELDSCGAPVYRDSRSKLPGRVGRWALTTAAALLAACHRGASVGAGEAPTPNAGTTQNSTVMGKVRQPEVVGDVAVPQAQPLEKLGEVAAPPQPQAPPTAIKDVPPQKEPSVDSPPVDHRRQL